MVGDVAIGALIGVGFLTIVNIATVAFLFGKLTQQVKGHEQRIRDLEKARIRG